MGAGGNRSNDTLSREISHRNAARTIRGGGFFTPLRCGRNDDKGAANTVISSGGFMRRLSRGVLFCPRMGESPAQPDKGEPRSG